MNVFDTAFAGIDTGVETLFSLPNVALWIASGLLSWCAGIVIWNAYTRYRPFARALARRLTATALVDDFDDPVEARTAFAAAFPGIDAALSERAPGADGLRHGWAQFRDTLLDPAEVPLRATARPEGYFLHLGDETRALAWWANIFVALGLTFTFLGIVAALLKAVQAMGAGADPASMQMALVALLHITAAKFWTSIGGVVSSIILRVFDRRWQARIGSGLQLLCDRIEAGTRYVAPQRIATEHLVELRRQGERLAAGGPAADLAPVTERLSGILDAIGGRLGEVVSQASIGMDAAIRRATGAGDAQVETLGAAGDELKALLATLTRVVAEMGAVFVPMRDASRSIEAAVGTVQDTLGTLRQRTVASEEAMRAIAEGLADTSRTATRAWEGYADRFESVDAALAAALEQVRSASAEHAGLLTAQVGRIDSALAQAVDRLAGALAGIGDLVAALDDMRGEIGAGR